MEQPSEFLTALLLFVGLFLSWTKAAVSLTIALLVRNGRIGALAAAVVGAFEGLFGSRLEMLDLYLTRDGWAAIDTLTLITVVLSALASLAWWVAGRVVYRLARRIWPRA